MLPPGWAEIKGRDPKRAAHLCLEAGYLLASKEQEAVTAAVTKLPGMGKAVRVYVLTERVLADEGWPRGRMTPARRYQGAAECGSLFFCLMRARVRNREKRWLQWLHIYQTEL